MKRVVVVLVVGLVASGQGCTCGFEPSPQQQQPAACGGLEQPCCSPFSSCDWGLACAGTGNRCIVAPLDASKDATTDASLCGSGLACEQCDLGEGDAGFGAPRMGKPVVVPNACTQAELQAYVAACFSSTAPPGACSAWEQQDSGACGACLAPVTTASATWGPWVCPTPSTCETNVGGCVDLVLGTLADEVAQGGAGSCGDLLAADQSCSDAACGACLVSDSADFATCTQSSDVNECAVYATAESSPTGACAPIQGDAAPPAVATCFPQTDAEQLVFLDVFCGTGP